MNQNIELEIRKATRYDNLEEIVELIYKTDRYIYPYWFECIENVKSELVPLMLEENFFFNVNNFYIAIEKNTNKIIGATCIIDKSTNLNYDYTELANKNNRYKFTIDNYINTLIEEVRNADFAYISNVCVDENYRGRKIGTKMLLSVLEIYRDKLFKEIVLDVLADNNVAIKLYKNLGFEQCSENFKGFNDPSKERPNVFTMKNRLLN